MINIDSAKRVWVFFCFVIKLNWNILKKLYMKPSKQEILSAALLIA